MNLITPTDRDSETEQQRELREKEEIRAASAANPFDARSEVSADARHIVKHLWIIFVLLPVVLGILLVLLKLAA
jgi:hypothetical protein